MLIFETFAESFIADFLSAIYSQGVGGFGMYKFLENTVPLPHAFDVLAYTIWYIGPKNSAFPDLNTFPFCIPANQVVLLKLNSTVVAGADKVTAAS